jgi:hypothetical protein
MNEWQKSGSLNRVANDRIWVSPDWEGQLAGIVPRLTRLPLSALRDTKQGPREETYLSRPSIAIVQVPTKDDAEDRTRFAYQP